MKKYILILAVFAMACGQQTATTETAAVTEVTAGGQSNVKDDDSQQDVVKIAYNSGIPCICGCTYRNYDSGWHET